MIDPIDVLTTTAAQLREKLDSATVTSANLVQLYLDQIHRHNHHGLKLNAMISIAPTNLLLERAAILDRERAMGRTRGPLHGIPIIIKDKIMTGSSLGMDTTCGSYVLKGACVKDNAPIVDSILEAGMIILGKTNLSVIQLNYSSRFVQT